MDVENACKVIRELISLNEAGFELAREVMLAQERADELEHAAELSLARLRSEGHNGRAAPSERALDDAVVAFESADGAHAAEMEASTAYATHIELSHRAVEAARRLVAKLEPGGAEHDSEPAHPARPAEVEVARHWRPRQQFSVHGR